MAQRKQHCEVILKKKPTQPMENPLFTFLFLTQICFLLDHLNTNICLTLIHFYWERMHWVIQIRVPLLHFLHERGWRERTKNPNRHTKRMQRRKEEERSLPNHNHLILTMTAGSDSVPDNWGIKSLM